MILDFWNFPLGLLIGHVLFFGTWHYRKHQSKSCILHTDWIIPNLRRHFNFRSRGLYSSTLFCQGVSFKWEIFSNHYRGNEEKKHVRVGNLFRFAEEYTPLFISGLTWKPQAGLDVDLISDDGAGLASFFLGCKERREESLIVLVWRGPSDKTKCWHCGVEKCFNYLLKKFFC